MNSETVSSIVKVSYQKGDFIFFEGDLESHFYIVESGEVEIFFKNKSGQRVNILKVGPGESFGEFALLDKKPRSASAQALTPLTLVKVSEEGYEQLLSELPLWASSMLTSFMYRLKNMNKLMKDSDQFLDFTKISR